MREPFGMNPFEMVLFAMHVREDNPTALMPWDWEVYARSMSSQIECEVHMMWQYSKDGLDWLRTPHEWGEHWFIQPWLPSPNDRG